MGSTMSTRGPGRGPPRLLAQRRDRGRRPTVRWRCRPRSSLRGGLGVDAREVAAADVGLDAERAARPPRFVGGPRMPLDARTRGDRGAYSSAHAAPATPVPQPRSATSPVAGGPAAPRARTSARTTRKCERAIEERERGALARAVEGGAAREAIAPLDVGRRQRPQRAAHLGRTQVRQVTRLEGAEPRRGGSAGAAVSGSLTATV